VAVSADGQTCVAEQYGYLCQDGGRPGVVSPVAVDAEAMAAVFVCLPLCERAPLPDDARLAALLKSAKVSFGFRAKRWAADSASVRTGWEELALLPLARGVAPTPATNAEFEWLTALVPRIAGRLREDGSIDYREVGGTTVVHAEQELGLLVPSTPGTPGRNVLGCPLLPPPPRRIEVVLQSGVKVIDEGNEPLFVSEFAGALWHQQEVHSDRSGDRVRLLLAVHHVTTIDGDVDYHTGNIDFDGDVAIAGSVRALFTVRATGGITVDGMIEPGAHVRAGTTVTIAGGVCGPGTQVTAAGDVGAKYVQEAAIVSGASVTVSRYVMNASVRAAGQVLVLGQGAQRSGEVIGGLVWAAGGIRAQTVGSPLNASTRLITGIHPDHPERMQVLGQQQRGLATREAQLLATLRLRRVSAKAINRLLAANPERRTELLAQIARLGRVMLARRKVQERIDALVEEQHELARAAIVAVAGALHAATLVRLGDELMIVRQTQQTVLLRLAEDEEGTSIALSKYSG
jgi:uncharacterized protein (DUF342 family)